MVVGWIIREYGRRGVVAYVEMIQRQERANKVRFISFSFHFIAYLQTLHLICMMNLGLI